MRRLRWWEFRRRREVGSLVEEARHGVFYVDQAVIEEAVSLVAHDLSTTLGWEADRAEELARAEAKHMARVDCWEADVEFAFPFAVAESVQQVLHDTFEDTTWPSCPLHPRHPLWLVPEEDGLPGWRCPTDHTTYGTLGSLTTDRAR